MLARQPQPGDMVELVVEDLDDLGSGLGRTGGSGEVLRVHVAGALPGDRVAARLAHISGHARAEGREAWAEIGAVLEPSRDRVAPACPAHGQCGGCPLQGLAYAAQLHYKRRRVVAALARHPALAAVAVDACVPSPATLGYRNQAKLVYGRAGDAGRPVLGAFAPRSHRVVDLAGCVVLEPVLEEVRAALLGVLRDSKVEPFDERQRTGDLRYAVLHASQAGRVLVTLVAARLAWAEASAVARALAAACSAVVGVVLNVNPTAGNRIFGDQEQVLWGQGAIEDRIGDVGVRLAPRSFFQTNRQVAGLIFRAIAAAAPPGMVRALDVYSGAGPIALSLAPAAAEVIAIEENRAATAAAVSYLAQIGGHASRVRLVAGDAAESLTGIAAADYVVLDPPRKGCAAAVLAEMGRLRPRLAAYLACDPASLARDLARLVGSGARILRITPYDMLPHTPHVETLALASW